MLRKAVSGAVGIALASTFAVATGMPTAAFASGPVSPVGWTDDGEPIWQEGDQDKAPAPTGPVGTAQASHPSVRPLSQFCEPYNGRTETNTANTFDIKYRETDDNSASDSDDTWNVTVTTSGTTTFSLSVNIEEELKAGIFADVKASINGGIQKSMSTTTGTSHTTTVKAGHILRAEYGIWRDNFNWRTYHVFSNCKEGNVKAGTGYAPYTIAWRWIRVK